MPQDTPPSAGAGLLYSFSQFSVAANRSTNLSSEVSDVTAAPSQYIVLQFAATLIVTDVKVSETQALYHSLHVSMARRLQEGREYSVSEVHSVDAEATRLTMEVMMIMMMMRRRTIMMIMMIITVMMTMQDPHSNATNTCSYHSKGGWGHSTTGVRYDFPHNIALIDEFYSTFYCVKVIKITLFILSVLFSFL